METANHEYYVSLEVAKLLKESGFDWPSYAHYCPTEMNGIYFNNYAITYHGPCITAPTLEVAQRWLREVKGYAVSVYPSDESDGWLVSLDLTEDSSSIWTKDLNNTYEEALEAGIKKALKIILEKGE